MYFELFKLYNYECLKEKKVNYQGTHLKNNNIYFTVLNLTLKNTFTFHNFHI